MKYSSSFDFFQWFKNMKTILIPKAVQKQAVGWIWPVGQKAELCYPLGIN